MLGCYAEAASGAAPQLIRIKAPPPHAPIIFVRVELSERNSFVTWCIRGGFSMAILRWEPFREMENALRRFSPLYMPDSGTIREEAAARIWVPLANISEKDNEYLIRLELPDVKKEDVKIAVSEGIITISGERKMELEDQNENVIRVESIYGTFTRSFVLPDNVDVKGIRAEAKDGVLQLHIPKAETKKSEPVKIEVH
jgi:HSP20 family protein